MFFGRFCCWFVCTSYMIQTKYTYEPIFHVRSVLLLVSCYYSNSWRVLDHVLALYVPVANGNTYVYWALMFTLSHDLAHITVIMCLLFVIDVHTQYVRLHLHLIDTHATICVGNGLIAPLAQRKGKILQTLYRQIRFYDVIYPLCLE